MQHGLQKWSWRISCYLTGTSYWYLRQLEPLQEKHFYRKEDCPTERLREDTEFSSSHLDKALISLVSPSWRRRHIRLRNSPKAQRDACKFVASPRSSWGRTTCKSSQRSQDRDSRFKHGTFVTGISSPAASFSCSSNCNSSDLIYAMLCMKEKE